MPTHPEFDPTPEREINPAPHAHESVCLPFLLLDSDQTNAVRLVSVPVVTPPEWLAAILYLSTSPGQIPDGDATEVWQTCAAYLLLAGVEHLAAQVRKVRRATNADPDAFVWFEQCRRRIVNLFASPDDVAGPGTPAGQPW